MSKSNKQKNVIENPIVEFKQYLPRGVKNRKRGVIVCRVDRLGQEGNSGQPQIQLGWALCNTKTDKFDAALGEKIAVGRLQNTGFWFPISNFYLYNSDSAEIRRWLHTTICQIETMKNIKFPDSMVQRGCLDFLAARIYRILNPRPKKTQKKSKRN